MICMKFEGVNRDNYLVVCIRDPDVCQYTRKVSERVDVKMEFCPGCGFNEAGEEQLSLKINDSEE